MGAYADLKVGQLSLLWWKNDVDKNLLGLFFTDDDLKVIENVKYDNDDIEEEPHTEYVYSTTVQKAIDRLNAVGYTLNSIESQFNECMLRCIDYYPLLWDRYEDDLDEIQEERIRKYVTFKKWYNSVLKYARYGFEHGLHFYPDDNVDPTIIPKTECDKIVFKSIKDGDESYFGCLYKEFSPINTIRLILEKFPKDEELFVNLSEILEWSYTAIDELYVGEPTEKNIVLVEGTNDKSILEFALKNIYPHLSNLYYFMDFEFGNSMKRRGGVDTISNNLKAFVCSKLSARFIAVFDNDAVGTQAMKRLVFELGDLPNNIRVITYPNIERAKKYPTVGINGKKIFDNINGRACSIELYLPDFLLKKGSGFPPVEWESRIRTKIGNQELQEYQGVISLKSEIESNFKEYKKSVEKGNVDFDNTKWSDMKGLLDTIIYSFDS